MKRKNKTSLIKPVVKALPVFALLVLVVYAGNLLRDIDMPTVLPVTDVQVEGELQFLNKDAIEAIVRENITGGYFTVDLSNIRMILLREPWVENVSLRRKWPASLNVSVVEHVPVAYWNKDAYLNEKGDVFAPLYIDKRLNLPTLNGPAGQHHNVWKFMNVLYKETALLNYEVVRLVLDERRAWQLVISRNDDALNTEIDVKLGRFDTDKRMQRFMRILPALASAHGLAKSASSENRIKLIDMRYPNGFAVQMIKDETGNSKVVSSVSADKNAVNNYKDLILPDKFASTHKAALKQVSKA